MIIRRLAVAVCLLSTAACSVPPAPSSAPLSTNTAARRPASEADRVAIEAVLRRFTEAQKNYDAAAMGELLAPDYVEVSPDGAVDERAKVLGFYTPERKAAAGVDLTEYAIRELTTRIYGDTAVVVALVPFTMAGGPGAAPTTHAFRNTYVLVRHGDRWLVSSAQATLVRPAEPGRAAS